MKVLIGLMIFLFAGSGFSQLDNITGDKKQAYVNDMNGQNQYDMINKNVGKLNDLIGQIKALESRVSSLEKQVGALQANSASNDKDSE